MSKNEQTVDLGNYNKPTEQKTSVGIKLIEGRPIHITGFQHTRGKPTKYTRPDQIGQDGKTDYFTITTAETFKLPPKKGEPEEDINSFFITEAISKQIERVPNVQEEFAKGVRFGPCKATKRTGKDTGNPYWCLAFPSDEDYE